MSGKLRVLTAPNPGLFTLDGTCTYLLGSERVVVIDPGPAIPEHLEAVLALVGGAESVKILLTHGHPDHAAGAAGLALAVGAEVLGPGPGATALGEGERVESDAGVLTALRAPGHTPDHLMFHWPAGRAAFVGDLLLGRGDTTWVAGYPGCVADYLESLDRLAGLDLEEIHPGHGPTLEDPRAVIKRFRAHREHRIDQVREARILHPGASAEDLVPTVYGDTVPSSMIGPARESIRAILDHLGEAVFPDGVGHWTAEPG